MFTVGCQRVFCLTQWSAQIHAKFHVHRVTQGTFRLAVVFNNGALTLCGALFQALCLTRLHHVKALQPRRKTSGLGTSAFVRHYLRNRIRFLFLTLLRCFTSGGIACPLIPVSQNAAGRNAYALQVIPFGNPRLMAVLQLTGAYRSLSRPSSPAGTKAFTICPLLFCFNFLNLIFQHHRICMRLCRTLCLFSFLYAVVNERHGLHLYH